MVVLMMVMVVVMLVLFDSTLCRCCLNGRSLVSCSLCSCRTLNRSQIHTFQFSLNRDAGPVHKRPAHKCASLSTVRALLVQGQTVRSLCKA